VPWQNEFNRRKPVSTQPADVLKILEANYLKAINLLPPDLSHEFQNKVIRRPDLKEYAGQISIAIQFRDETSMQLIQNWMVEHFNKGGFGRKLYQKGINPSQVYEALLKGIYDYK
jgi:hypothetical protein